LKELVESIAKQIVNFPDDVKVTESTESNEVLIKLEVNTEDKGKIIGKQGRIAEAIRTILRVVAIKQGVRIKLEIV
jgi:uncharacterized protein